MLLNVTFGVSSAAVLFIFLSIPFHTGRAVYVNAFNYVFVAGTFSNNLLENLRCPKLLYDSSISATYCGVNSNIYIYKAQP